MEIAEEFTVLVWILLAAQQMLRRSYVYWDHDADGLKEHWFWKTKSVPLQRYEPGEFAESTMGIVGFRQN